MPSGYTSKVQSGEVTDFKDYAKLCSRAFLIHLRDEDMDKEIYKRKPEKYYKDKIKKTIDEIATFKKLTFENVKAKIDKENSEIDESNKKHEEKRQQDLSRYEKMLKAVESWNPPTEMHQGIKDFMRKQLQESISFDCQEYKQEKINIDLGEWFDSKLKKLNSDLKYYQEEYEKEEKRCNETNKWIDDLLGSLND